MSMEWPTCAESWRCQRRRCTTQVHDWLHGAARCCMGPLCCFFPHGHALRAL